MFNPVHIDQRSIQLENGIREAMLQRNQAKGLVVLEGLYFLKLQPDTWLTFEQVYRLLRNNFGCSYRLVYEGLQSSLIFQRRKMKARAPAPRMSISLPHPPPVAAQS